MTGDDAIIVVVWPLKIRTRSIFCGLCILQYLFL